MEPPKKRGRSTAKSGGVSVKQRFISLLKDSGKPVSDATLREEFGDLKVVVPVMQALSKTGNLQISSQGSEQFYEWVDDRKAQSLKGLTPEQKYVYQIIASHGNRGVYMRDLKFKASQSLTEIKHTLRKLKTKQLVKSINDIDNKTRQILILYDLDPHPDCTGGAWYSSSEFDMQLIKQARMGVLARLRVAHKRGLPGLKVSQLVKQLKDSGAFAVDLGVKDIFQLMTTMELDLKVQRVADDAGAKSASGDSLDAAAATMFAVKKNPVHFNLLTRSPCGTCPVFDQCSPGGPVSPGTCTYLEAWLGGADSW